MLFYFILFFHFNEVRSIHKFFKQYNVLLFVLFNRGIKVNLFKLYLQSFCRVTNRSPNPGRKGYGPNKLSTINL